jgi:ATP-dependent DNA helicase RecQ
LSGKARSRRRSSPKSGGQVVETGPLSDEGEALFQSLRDLRKSIADGQGVPAYIVFSDKALRAMAEARPSTPGEFLAISGVGPLKLERYGEVFLEALNGGSSSG